MPRRFQPDVTVKGSWWKIHFIKNDEEAFHLYVRALNGAAHPQVGEFMRFHGKNEPVGAWGVYGVQHTFIRGIKRVQIWVKQVAD